MLIGVLLLLGGCEPDEESFPDAFANAYCVRLSECYLAAYEGLYDREADECRDTVADQFEYFDEASCNFDEDDAADCLTDLRNDDCEDLFYAASYPDSCSRICE